MKHSNLIHILKCINCETTELTLVEKEDKIICNGCQKSYTITQNVPELLSERKSNVETQSGIHNTFGTSFQYVDHYQKDAFNSDYFAKRDPATEHSEKRVREQISAQITSKSGLILDVGCGKAWVAGLFCPKGFEVISLDISLRNTSKALKKYPYENHSTVVADVFNLPFQPRLFDYIIASEIIEHVPNPELFVENLFRVLKPGGKLIVTTPYKEKLHFSLCIHCNRPTPLHAHIHSFDEHVLENLYHGPDLATIEHRVFNSKLLLHFRTHIFLKHLNFELWNLVDRLTNFICRVPARIIVVWKKVGK